MIGIIVVGTAHKGLTESEVDNSPLGAAQYSELCILIRDHMNTVWVPPWVQRFTAEEGPA